MARQELIIKKRKDSERLALKIALVKHLMKHGISKKKIQVILDFIKYYTSFEQSDFFSKFDNDIQSIIKSRKAMGLREAILNEFKEMGLAEGLKKGLEEGREEGLAEGHEEKERIFVLRGMEKNLSIEDIAFLADISVEKVQMIIQEFQESKEEEV